MKTPRISAALAAILALLLAAPALLSAPDEEVSPPPEEPKPVTLKSDPERYARDAVADVLSNDAAAKRFGAVRMIRAGELAVPYLLDTLASPKAGDGLKQRAIYALQSLESRAVAPLAEMLVKTERASLASTLCDILSNAKSDVALTTLLLVRETSKNELVKASAATALKRTTGKTAAQAGSAFPQLMRLAGRHYARARAAGRQPHSPLVKIWTVAGDRLVAQPVFGRKDYNLHLAERYARLALRARPASPVALSHLIGARAARFHTLDALARSGQAGLPMIEGNQSLDLIALKEERDRLAGSLRRLKAAGPDSLLSAIRLAADRDSYAAAGELVGLLEQMTDPGKPVTQEAQTTLRRLLTGNDKLARYRAALYLARRPEPMAKLETPQPPPDPRTALRTVLAHAVREAAGTTVLIVHPNEVARNTLKALVPGRDRQILEADSPQAALTILADTHSAVDLVFIAHEPKTTLVGDFIASLDPAHVVANLKIVVVLPTQKAVKNGAGTLFAPMKGVIGTIGQDATRSDVKALVADALLSGDGLYRKELDAFALEAMRWLAKSASGGPHAAGTADLLREMMNHGTTALRAAALTGLGLLGEESDAQRFAMELLSTRLPVELRVAAGHAAGRICNRIGKVPADVLAKLKRGLADSNPKIREAAATALGTAPLDPITKAELFSK